MHINYQCDKYSYNQGTVLVRSSHMPVQRGLLQSLSIIVILAMLFSGFPLSSVFAQAADGLQRQVNAQTGKVSFIGPEGARLLSAAKALGTGAAIRPQDPALALAKR